MANIANELGVRIETFYTWEKKLPIVAKDCEGLWEKLLHVPPGWLRNPSMPVSQDIATVEQYPVLQELSEATRIDLGQRASVRRQELGIRISVLAKELNIASKTLQSWECKLPDLPKCDESIWEKILLVPRGWLRDPSPTPLDGVGVTDNHAYPLREMDSEERERLGQRAAHRRTELKLSVRRMAEQLGVKQQNLIGWEKSLTKTPRQIEAAWEEQLLVPKGWLRNQHAKTPSISLGNIQIPSGMSNTVSQEIRAIGAWLAISRPLSRTCEMDKLDPIQQRWAEMFAQRYGVLGEEESTLQRIGDVHQVTRERVRQITEKMLSRAHAIKVETPCINRLANSLPSYLPRTIIELDGLLRQELGESLSLLSVDRFCREILGRNIMTLSTNPADMNLPLRDNVVIHADQHESDVLRAIRTVSIDMIRQRGAAQLHFVCGAASELLDRPLRFDEVKKYCRILYRFEWLIEKEGWFWLGFGPDNSLVNRAMKLFTFSNRKMDVEEITGGLVRSRRDKYSDAPARQFTFELPNTVVVQVLQRLPFLQVQQYNDFRLNPDVPIPNALSESEQLIGSCLIRHGGIAAKHTIMQEMERVSTISPIGVNMCLGDSPIFFQPDFGLYTLRGYSYSPQALQTALEHVGGFQTRTTVTDADGIVSVTFLFSEYMHKHRVLYVPASLARFMSPGDYAVAGFDTPAIYSLTSNAPSRLRKFIIKLLMKGFVVGDSFTLQLDRHKREITFQLVPSSDTLPVAATSETAR